LVVIVIVIVVVIIVVIIVVVVISCRLSLLARYALRPSASARRA
jgi:uncharacterized protein YpmB